MWVGPHYCYEAKGRVYTEQQRSYRVQLKKNKSMIMLHITIYIIDKDMHMCTPQTSSELAPFAQPYQHDIIDVTDRCDVLCNLEAIQISLDHFMTEDGRVNIIMGQNYKLQFYLRSFLIGLEMNAFTKSNI